MVRPGWKVAHWTAMIVVNTPVIVWWRYLNICEAGGFSWWGGIIWQCWVVLTSVVARCVITSLTIHKVTIFIQYIFNIYSRCNHLKSWCHCSMSFSCPLLDDSSMLKSFKCYLSQRKHAVNPSISEICTKVRYSANEDSSFYLNIQVIIVTWKMAHAPKNSVLLI